MSIASEITRLQTAKADIKTAIEAKGVTVPANAKLDDYDTYVASIPTGGTNTLNETLEGTKTSLTLTDIGNATKITPALFEGNTNLASIQIPTSGNFYLWDNCFKDCINLTGTFVFPKRNSNERTSLKGENQFRNTGYSSIYMQDIKGEPGVKGGSSYGYFFAECTNLTTVTFGNNVETGAIKSAFSKCTALTTVNFDNDSTLYLTGGISTFSQCTSLTTFTSPSNVIISGQAMFSGCTALTTVTLGASTTLGSYMFSGCTALTDVYLTYENSIFSTYTNTFPTNATPINVHVPASLLATYQADSSWATLVTNNVITFVTI